MNHRLNRIPKEKLNAKSAHGYSIGQLLEIQDHQMAGTMPMVRANNCDNIKDELFAKDFAEGYSFQKHEEIHFHVAIESRTFDTRTGERLSASIVQIIDQPTYQMMLGIKPYDGFHGKVVHILHDPRKLKTDK